MVINKKEYVAEENVQEVALLHSEAFFSETDVYVYSDNQHVRIALSCISISNFVI
jgi:hypothetical protein